MLSKINSNTKIGAKKINKAIIIALVFILVLSTYSCGSSSAKLSQKKPYDTSIAIADTLPFHLSEYNNILFEVILNDKDSVILKFDSGATGLLLTHKAIKNKTSLLSERQKAKPTQNYVKLKGRSSIAINNQRWDNLEIYPVSRSGHGTDGRFGWDLFKGKIVEINYDRSILVIHPKLPSTTGFTKLKLFPSKTLFSISGEMIVKGKTYEGPFLFDTGYQKSVLLDSSLLVEQKFPKDLELIKTNKLTNGAGEVFITKVVKMPELRLGAQMCKNIPTQLLNTRNPAGFQTHFLGNELLKRFNTIFDFSSMEVYLKENSLIDLAYSDTKK
ncbi:MAG: hypothetical protein AAF696_32310 [Bacteroidota bacterium]